MRTTPGAPQGQPEGMTDVEKLPERITWPKIVLSAIVAITLFAIGLLWWQQVRSASPAVVAEQIIARAKSALPGLRIVEPLPLDDYDRAFFGPAWQKLEPHPCDTRNEVMQEWFVEFDTIATSECSVESGWFMDPYTGHYVQFVRGKNTSHEVHIDHVVALADAWSKGAAQWPRSRAQEFATDPLNLLPTQAWVNTAKGAHDASRWLPPNEGLWCFFGIQQVLVKEKYDLGVTDAELAALQKTLDTCT